MDLRCSSKFETKRKNASRDWAASSEAGRVPRLYVVLSTQVTHAPWYANADIYSDYITVKFTYLIHSEDDREAAAPAAAHGFQKSGPEP